MPYSSDIASDIAITTSDADATHRASGSAESLGAISRALVQLLRHRVGRGPTQARTHWAGDDALLALLGDGLTKAEQTLFTRGRSDSARAYRDAVMDALEDDMRAVVEQHTGRHVVACMGCVSHDVDVMAEVFLLEPLGGRDSMRVSYGGAGSRPASPHLPDVHSAER